MFTLADVGTTLSEILTEKYIIYEIEKELFVYSDGLYARVATLEPKTRTEYVAGCMVGGHYVEGHWKSSSRQSGHWVGGYHRGGYWRDAETRIVPDGTQWIRTKENEIFVGPPDGGNIMGKWPEELIDLL